MIDLQKHYLKIVHEKTKIDSHLFYDMKSEN